MKRTNDPSAKKWLQATIKKALEDNPGMTTQEFISSLENKGINLLFNQASTGYVSGVSYGYDAFLVTGSKLGNDFKWTTIKNTINYIQERDRTAIQQANDRTRSLKLEPETGLGNSKRINTLPKYDGSYGGLELDKFVKDLTSAKEFDYASPESSLQLKKKKRRKGRSI